MSGSKWTEENIKLLVSLRVNQGLTWPEVAKKLGVSAASARKKFSRLKTQKLEKKTDKVDPKKKKFSFWSNEEVDKMRAYLDDGHSYAFIAEKIGRSKNAVAKKCQSLDWYAIKSSNLTEDKEPADLSESLANALVTLSRRNYENINSYEEEKFIEKTNLEELPMPFSEIKNLAIKELDKWGLANDSFRELGEGTYIVVGDAHGKHTKTRMFDLISQVNDYFNANNVIHIGHFVDDDNEISYNWGNFDNLIVLAKEEELQLVHSQRHSHDCDYDIILSEIQMGDELSITNQDMITDYVQTGIRNLDNEIYGGKMIVNCHRMEAISKASDTGTAHYVVSPGGLCEPHVARTIKQINFTEGKTVKYAFPESFSGYRKRKIKCKYWNQGLLVVHVDSLGDHTIIPCPIKKIDNDTYATSYFDKIISSDGVHNPQTKIFVTADTHTPKHDTKILDIQEQVCKDYAPDHYVNIGDSMDVTSLNHHEMDRGAVVYGEYLREAAQTNFVMKRQAKWAKYPHAIVGNHERFQQDFTKKYPQLASILDFEFVCDLKSLGYALTSLKDVLHIGDANFVHGDLIVFNQTGNKLEKLSRALGHNTFMGHIHYPAIRFGCFSVGLSGALNQGYNEAEASCWIHGLGFCNQYKGMSWPTTLAIFDYKLILNDKTYEPVDPDSWDIGEFKARISYEFDKQTS